MIPKWIHRNTLIPIVSLIAFALLTSLARAETTPSDWPQWRGPNRDGTTSAQGWFVSGSTLKKIWTVSLGQGYSGISVVGNRLFTLGNQKGNDIVYCLNVTDGKPLWTASYPCAAGSYAGPRATPTVEGNRVYTLSREGHINCWDAESGKAIWSRQIEADLKLGPPGWGFSSSPLVYQNLVVVNAGKSGLALEKTTGKTIWQSKEGAPGYATPVILTPQGKATLALFGARAFWGVDPLSGKILWEYPWKTAYDVNAADPVGEGNKVFVTSGYGHGGTLFKIDADHHISVVWEGKQLKSHFSSPVLFNGFLFGIDGNTGGGEIKCLDYATGKVLWSNGSMGFGSLIVADGKLVIQSESGELAIAEANSRGYHELARAKIIEGKCWTAPVVAAGHIFCRNDKGTLICLDATGR